MEGFILKKDYIGKVDAFVENNSNNNNNNFIISAKF